MGSDDTHIVSLEFEVFGEVQGRYFTKYCKEKCTELGIGGWVKNSKRGTIVGKIQGTKPNIEEMVAWLSKTGSPGCVIDRCDLSNFEYMSRQDFRGFSIRVAWLSKTGSPGCVIDRCDLSNFEYMSRQDFRGFSIRF